MKLTYSVTDGGKLCTCGHLKCCHHMGNGQCSECLLIFRQTKKPSDYCPQFLDRAEVNRAA